MSVDRTDRAYDAPLIRLRHLLPPQKTAGGEGLSIEMRGKGFKQTVGSAGQARRSSTNNVRQAQTTPLKRRERGVTDHAAAPQTTRQRRRQRGNAADNAPEAHHELVRPP